MKRKSFTPDLSPKEMLDAGVFGGAYFTASERAEFPADWFAGGRVSDHGFDVSLNRFGVAAGQSREEWQAKGWITPEDPLGWFQWYCRYALGRRIPEVDAFQIGRWAAFGPRHLAQIRRNCEPMDLNCRRRQRQALLQWAVDPVF
jgi:hypothetical protein